MSTVARPKHETPLGGPALGPGASLSGADLRQAELSGLDLRGAELSGADLRGVRAVRMCLVDANLHGAKLDGAQLLHCDLTKADLSEVSAVEAGLGGCTLDDAVLFAADLTDSGMSQVSLKRADLRRANFTRARLRESDLAGADVTQADLTGADLTESNVDGATFRDADIQSAHLQGMVGYHHAEWIGCNVTGADFSNAYLVRRTIIDQNYLHEFRSQSRTHEWIYRLWWLSSDCGRSYKRWGLWTLLLAVSFAGLYEVVDIDYGEEKTALSSIYFSIVTLTTLGYGDVLPSSQTAQAVVIAQVVIGYVMLGGLLSLFSAKVSRRGE